MSTAIDNLMSAMLHAASIRPHTGGFPVLAEVLRQAGIKKNYWYLPSCQSVYITEKGNIVSQGTPLVAGNADIPEFHPEQLITSIQQDKDGASTFHEFLHAAWNSGVMSYTVDFDNRTVTYYGVLGESYVEQYPEVSIDNFK